MSRRFTPLFLFASGLLLLAIGGAILFAPHAFHATNGIALGDNADLLSEVRAPGGLLAACAVLILMGAARRPHRGPAVAITVLAYGSFGVARLVGMVLDGMPSSGLVVATALELAVAAVGAALLVRSETLGPAGRGTALERPGGSSLPSV